MTISLLTSLRRELEDAWHTLHARYPGERFYAFGVYANDVASWFGAVACTEEGLERVAFRYAKARASAMNLERSALRWSMGDSPLLEEALTLLPKTQALRGEEPDPYSDEEGAEAATDAFFRAATQALQQMDEEGVFGVEAEREKLVVSVWLNDESNEDMLATARHLNSDIIVRRYAEELDAGIKAYFARVNQGGANEA
jgi:hypothetical protein